MLLFQCMEKMGFGPAIAAPGDREMRPTLDYPEEPLRCSCNHLSAGEGVSGHTRSALVLWLLVHFGCCGERFRSQYVTCWQI